MTEVKKNDFMRAVYYHRLDVRPSSGVAKEGCTTEFTLGTDLVCRVVTITDYANGDKVTTHVSDWFKKKYMDTTPNVAYRCKTCALRHDCKIIRTDTDEFCNLWRGDEICSKAMQKK